MPKCPVTDFVMGRKFPDPDDDFGSSLHHNYTLSNRFCPNADMGQGNEVAIKNGDPDEEVAKIGDLLK